MMRTVFVLFDSLNRSALEPYGSQSIQTPNMTRLAERAVTFDQHFVGSLPCMPARRDLHTGRLNFMHRSWGPLEPFDNSFPKLMSKAGIYTHLITDHMHYFEDGGNGYAQAFDSWEFVRGQENDPWHAIVEPRLAKLRSQFDPAHYDLPETGPATREAMSRWQWKKLRHAVNRQVIRAERDYPTVQCFERAIEFLARNRGADDWFLQLEAFDPHEPFMAPDRFKAMYPTDWQGGILDWPQYARAGGDTAQRAEIRSNYAALVTMCDNQLGRLMDTFDILDLWKDTCLIVTTDHGYLLAEHEWWGKNRMPYYSEISHIPLMVCHPDMAERAGARCTALTQTPDLMPSLLDLHGIAAPEECLGNSIWPMLRQADPDRTVLFGQFGGPLGLSDGRHLMFRYPRNVACEGLNEYTLSPQHMSSAFTVDELQGIALAPPFNFTKSVQTLRIPARRDGIRPPGLADEFDCGVRTEIFDLVQDPGQGHPVNDPALEARLLAVMLAHLHDNDAPAELLAFYGFDASPARTTVNADRPEPVARLAR
jgi:arylsulfatase A-like enzyme